MRKLTLYILFLAPLFFLILSNGCRIKNNPTPWPVYSFIDPIVNPPDTFQVVYNISQDGDRVAYITFENDAVWLIEKLGDSRINYWTSNGDTIRDLNFADTLGLRGGFTYYFVANNNNYDDFNNFFTQFTRLGLDYATFEPKF